MTVQKILAALFSSLDGPIVQTPAVARTRSDREREELFFSLYEICGVYRRSVVIFCWENAKFVRRNVSPKLLNAASLLTCRVGVRLHRFVPLQL